MPKVRDSSGTIGTIKSPICLSCMSLRMIATKAIVVANSRLPELFLNSSHSVFRRHGQRRSHHLPLGHVAAKAFPPLADILHFWAVVRGPIERRLRDLVVRDGDTEAGAEKADFVLVSFFC